MPRRDPNPEFPATILISGAEQLPYTFRGIAADQEFGGGVWRVATQTLHLETGDYTLDGYATQVGCERKSKADLFRTIGQERDRFVRELERFSTYRFAAVVVEAGWDEILNDPPPYSQLDPRLIYRSVLAWQQRYPCVHWWFVADRDMGEVTTLRILERFLREQADVNFRKPKVK